MTNYKTISSQLFLENKISEEDFFVRNNISDDDLSYLGKGDFGEAYYVGDDYKRVLKKTSSKSEFDIAQKIMEAQKSSKWISERFVIIYDVADIEGGYYYILQEYLEDDYDIEDNYYRLLEILDAQGLDMLHIHLVDEDELDDADKDVLPFMREIEDIVYTCRKLDIQIPDLRPENLGKDSKGNIKMFDIDDRAMHT